MPCFARAIAVQVQWLGHVPVFPACGAQVVMHACTCSLMSVWREAGQGAGGYDGRVRWHSVAAAASFCRLLLCAWVEVGRVRVRAGCEMYMRMVWRREPLCAWWIAGVLLKEEWDREEGSTKLCLCDRFLI
ncbi:hypothetical protein B0H13DRAFT_2374455 [Mycena leptocephala]|nr:hypothetical protein B0H13DRAFT_2374455 [Mycena leptocephala]